MNSLLRDIKCRTCENRIPKGNWFCAVCGRSRFLQIKQWELLVSTILITICLLGLISVPIAHSGATLTTSTPFQGSTPVLRSAPITFTPSIFNTPTIEYIASNIVPSSPDVSCPGSQPQRVEVGRRGFVCTQYDRLIVRTGPGSNESEITRIEPDTYFRVVSGPICANNWSWWEIKTDSKIVGWVAEGGDNVDPYFICPQSLSSP